MRTRSARSLIALLALVVVTAAPACGPWHHQGDDQSPTGAGASLAIAGSASALQPQISTAAVGGGDLTLAVRLPQRGYLTTLRVFPGEHFMRLLTTSEGEGATTRTEVAAGDHRFMLRPAPVFLAPNAVHAIADADHAADLRQNGIPELPRPEYTLVVVTAQPVSWGTVQEALAGIDLATGSPPDVVARVARALGAASGGEWGAAARVTRQLW
ncbi:MAG TPA: hypothetical protein VNS52_01975 [Gemmatimonadaceae bacterium]|nr:hypothetical protein [Gemmatimonadaceae bacterium]